MTREKKHVPDDEPGQDYDAQDYNHEEQVRRERFFESLRVKDKDVSD